MTSKQPPRQLLFWASLYCTPHGMFSGDPTSLLPRSYCTSCSQPLCATSIVRSCCFANAQSPARHSRQKVGKMRRTPRWAASPPETPGQDTFPSISFLSCPCTRAPPSCKTQHFLTKVGVTQFEYGDGKSCWQKRLGTKLWGLKPFSHNTTPEDRTII